MSLGLTTCVLDLAIEHIKPLNSGLLLCRRKLARGKRNVGRSKEGKLVCRDQQVARGITINDYTVLLGHLSFIRIW